jgi:hypothetical protein
MSRHPSCGAAIPTLAALALVSSALTSASPSRAEEAEATLGKAPPPSTIVVAMEPMPTPDTFKWQYETRGPNLVTIGGGAVALGVSYGIAAIVGAASGHLGDSRLFVPVFGPWLDLADRGGCGKAGGTTCDSEAINQFSVVIDGVFQGLGALAILSGFVFPGQREVLTRTRAAAPTVRVAPVQYGRGGVGLAAFASF